jgi:hypothetical protein
MDIVQRTLLRKYFSGWPKLPKNFFRGTFDRRLIPFSFDLIYV